MLLLLERILLLQQIMIRRILLNIGIDRIFIHLSNIFSRNSLTPFWKDYKTSNDQNWYANCGYLCIYGKFEDTKMWNNMYMQRAAEHLLQYSVNEMSPLFGFRFFSFARKDR